MKKIIFSAAFVVASIAVSAQSLKDVNTMIALRQFEKAKPAIEAVLADPKNASKPEAWYAKGEVYQNLSLDANVPVDQKYQMKMDAFEAFKKVQELDSKDKIMKDEQYRSFLYLYSGLFDIGVTHFNNKDFANAVKSFKSTLDVHNYITSKGYKYTDVNLPAFDTSLVLNTAIASFQAKNEDEGRKYYQMLIDNNVASPNMQDTYEYMASYYADQKDDAKLKVVMDKGRKFFPESPFWNQVEINKVKATGDKKAMFAKYEELTAANPKDFNLAYNYSVELFNTRFGNDEAESKTVTNEQLENAINKAMAIDTSIASSNMYANYKYNIVYNTNDELAAVKGTTPSATQKRNAIKATLMKQTDEAIASVQKVLNHYDSLPELNASQKVHYNNHVNHMVDFYKIKGDMKTSNEWKTKSKN